jgi:uncharacterized membrane protein YcaP (DUF421 family)
MKDLIKVSGRIATIYPLVLIITMYMGKRSIGELPVFDFLIIITLGAVVGADIADPQIAHIHTAAAIILIALLQRFVSKLVIKYRKFGHMITFEPTVVVQDGQFVVNNLKKLRYSIDNVLQMLREKDIFDVSEVHLGIIESNGRLSVLKKMDKTTVTIEDLKISKQSPSLSYPVVIDGVIYVNVLKRLGLSEEWLENQLRNLNIQNSAQVFFASVNCKQELHVSLKNFMNNEESTYPIYN